MISKHITIITTNNQVHYVLRSTMAKSQCHFSFNTLAFVKCANKLQKEQSFIWVVCRGKIKFSNFLKMDINSFVNYKKFLAMYLKSFKLVKGMQYFPLYLHCPQKRSRNINCDGISMNDQSTTITTSFLK